MNPNKIIKYLSVQLLFTILCSVCLIYQTGQILTIYLKKNSVTNIRFARNTIETMPGITICFDRLYSFENVFKHFKQYEDLYKNYTDFTARIDGMKEKDLDHWKRSKQVDKSYLEENSFYENRYASIVYENFSMEQLSKFNMQDYFEKFTLPFKFLEKGNMKNSIRLRLSGELNDFNTLVEYFEFNNKSKLYDYILPPIETMYLVWKGVKCFTFFSWLQMKRFKANINKISITIEFPMSWFPFSSDRKVRLAIHSPNLMPAQDKFFEVDQATWNKVFFTKIENNELTDYAKCFNYEFNGKLDSYKMKSDCNFDCMKKLVPNCTIGILARRKRSTRKEHLPSSSSNGTCDKARFDSQYDSIRRICTRKCREECYQAYYLSQLKTSFAKVQPNLTILDNDINIDFEPSSLPNIIVNHMPEMSFLSFLCSFGGLLGMLLGTSLLEILTHLWFISKKIYIKLISLKIFDSNIDYNRNNVIVVISSGSRPSYMSDKYTWK